MAWNPHPKVADCRDIARKWGKEQVIIIAIDGAGRLDMATYGQTMKLCGCAKQLGDTAFNAIEARIANACAMLSNDRADLPPTEDVVRDCGTETRDGG